MQPASTGDHIKLLCDVTEDVTASGNVALDLAGHTLTGSVTLTNGALSGLDSSGVYEINNQTHEANYKLPTGKITGSISALATDDTSGQVVRYVAIKDAAGATSFHRFNISVTGFRALFDPVDNSAVMFYTAIARGDSAVASAVEAYGFELDPDSQYANTATFQMNTPFESPLGWGGILDAGNAGTKYGARAYLTIDGNALYSVRREITLLDALAVAYNSDGLSVYNEGGSTRDPKVILDEAMESLGLTEKWAAAKANP